MHLLLPLLISTTTALADAPAGPIPAAPPPIEVPSAVDPATGPFALVLEQAKDEFVIGEHRAALALFDVLHGRIADGERVPEALIVEALQYRGEVQYKLGDVVASWDTFREVLLRDPDAEMSPYHHHAEVVEQFNVVRRAVRLEIASRPPPSPPVLPPRRPAPVWAYLPFGAPQLGQRQVVRGIVYGTLQAGFAITSIAAYDRLQRLNRPRNPFGVPDREVAKVVQRERYLIQWPATVLSYAFVMVSVIDGTTHWRTRQDALRLAIVPDPDAPGVGLGGRF